MNNCIEIDVELLSKLQMIADKENLSLKDLLEVSIINMLIEKGEYGRV